MTENPYAAPQTVPPPDKQRWKRWLGMLLIVMSLLFAIVALFAFALYLGVLSSDRPSRSDAVEMIGFVATFFHASIAAALWFTGHWLWKKGQPARDNQ